MPPWVGLLPMVTMNHTNMLDYMYICILKRGSAIEADRMGK